MVSSVSSAPYSYLDQLITGKVTAPAVSAATATSAKNAKILETAKQFGLSPTVVALLQNVGGNNSVSSLLSKNSSTSDNPFASLFGYSTTKSSSTILADMTRDLFSIDSGSGLYQAALNGAASKKAAASRNFDYLSKIMTAYNAVVSQTPGNKLNITS